ncbi:MAG: lectin like domain-containing protein [Candidatus Aminicenantes bacterium]|nr:lectin like domain-containing protein [Candidatus Aminicenantes bacterium]
MIKKSKVSHVRILVLGFFLFSLSAGTIFLMSSGTFGEQHPMLKAAPLNPEFVRYLKEREMGRSRIQYTASGHPLGLLPAPLDLSQLHSLPAIHSIDYALPSTYDLRTKNKLTPVKDQGTCDSSWAFATYGSLESFLRPGATRDFSEQNLIDHHGFDSKPCDGGNIFMSTAYLARWLGPINETDDRYVYLPVDGLTPKKHVQNVIWLPRRLSSTDNSEIKSAVMKYGAVYVSMKWVDSCYKEINYAYYNEGTNEGGHSVTIVGWDDNFSKSKFNSAPSGNGAFIVRNSWGATWGQSGYFYVSYYDKYFGKESFNSVFQAEPVTNYKTNYGYDDLGWVNGIGWTGNSTAWFANIFTASAAGSIKAVSFYTSSTSSNVYDISIYTNVSANKPTSGQKAANKKGTITSPGYFTVPLSTFPAITKGKKFSVVVKLTTKDYYYPIPVEYPIVNYSSKAKAKLGQSFASADGTTWHDICGWGGGNTNTNACLKAFTK